LIKLGHSKKKIESGLIIVPRRQIVCLGKKHFSVVRLNIFSIYVENAQPCQDDHIKNIELSPFNFWPIWIWIVYIYIQFWLNETKFSFRTRIVDWKQANNYYICILIYICTCIQFGTRPISKDHFLNMKFFREILLLSSCRVFLYFENNFSNHGS
jgi:hypothetical protein